MRFCIEICLVKETIGYRIRKLRERKDYSQENMAGELGLSVSAYSKIERGITDPSIGRVTAIAEILEVNIGYFFDSPLKVEERDPNYGFATKSDIIALTEMIRKINHELASLKTAHAAPVSKKKAKK